MMTKQNKFILAVGAQVLVIFAIIIFKMTILIGGTEVLLKIAPVDPRDMLRGDYATFQYDISNIISYQFSEPIAKGDTVYVNLIKRGKYYIVEDAQKVKPTNGGIFIKGTVASGGTEDQSIDSPSRNLINTSVRVVYGAEDYFIPEGKGQGFNFGDKEAGAKVVIDDNGNAVLKQLYINDKPWP